LAVHTPLEKLLAHTSFEEEATNVKVAVTVVDLRESLLRDLRKLNENLKSRALGPNTRDNHNRVVHGSIEDLR
jgi:hypothetical protein